MEQKSPRVRLMLDSGVYAARQNGEDVNLDEYCQFIQRNQWRLWQYVNLDDIASPECSAENLQIMRARGLRPMPVFHCGEPVEFLNKMVSDGESYIGLSLTGDTLRDGELGELADEAFRVLRQHPTIRIHMFGLMAPHLLQRYRERLTSADASSWVQRPKFGGIYAPYWSEELNGYDYRNEQIAMTVEDLGKHSVKTEMIQRWLNDNGFGRGHIALARVLNGPVARRKALLKYYQQFCAANGITPVFAALPQKDASEQLNEMQADTRLLSYVMLRQWSTWDVSHYVKYGKPAPPKREAILESVRVAEQEGEPRPPAHDADGK